jgi:transcriptional regulator with XRE-family HTH domain
MTEPLARGETFRRRRLQRGLSLADAAAELGLPAKVLRAMEWDRSDLLGDDDAIARRYAEFLGLDASSPTVEAAEAAAAAPSPRRSMRALWVSLLAALAPPFLLGLVYVLGEVLSERGDGDGVSFGESQLIPLGLALLSSLLLIGAVLPPGVIARAGVSPMSFARYRQPLALAAIGLLVAVAVFTLLVELA